MWSATFDAGTDEMRRVTVQLRDLVAFVSAPFFSFVCFLHQDPTEGRPKDLATPFSHQAGSDSVVVALGPLGPNWKLG